MKKILLGLIAIVSVVLVIGTLSGAEFSNFYGKQDVRIYGNVTGTHYMRDTSAFDTTSLTKAIYVKGATSADIYVVTKRQALGVSTTALSDSCSIAYMAKTDSLIVSRNRSITSGLKFSYARFK